MRGAFIEAFTSEQRWMTTKKIMFLDWPLIQSFFIAHLQSLYDVKPKAQPERGAPYCAFGH
jgi:hypothetical protein